ncbi:MAG: hypothetical protein M1610_07885 [Nitrospirae bacterium]|nr:hypothetical protein [Nitrospirota bacterium]
MKNPKFSRWVRWEDRGKIDGIKNPGVYAIAITTKNISETPFLFNDKIVYFGMTNSGGGLQARLNQFNYTIAQKKRSVHGGAERFLYKYNNYSKLIKKLFVSVCAVECDVKSNCPQDLSKMGDVAKLEYYCFAKYVDKFKKLPEFNDKKKSPKK